MVADTSSRWVWSFSVASDGSLANGQGGEALLSNTTGDTNTALGMRRFTTGRSGPVGKR